jgi:hypothetical protein
MGGDFGGDTVKSSMDMFLLYTNAPFWREEKRWMLGCARCESCFDTLSCACKLWHSLTTIFISLAKQTLTIDGMERATKETLK